jgi:hypothetical protein
MYKNNKNKKDKFIQIVKDDTALPIEKDPRKTLLPVTVAILLLVGSVTYIYARTISNKNYRLKWQDYDECGI